MFLVITARSTEHLQNKSLVKLVPPQRLSATEKMPF